MEGSGVSKSKIQDVTPKQKENKKVMTIPDETQRKQVEKYVIRWGVLGFLLGSIVMLFSIPVNDYELLNLLGKVTPGIDIWTNGTIYQYSAKIMWIYVTYSVPFVIYKMVVTIKKAIILMPLYCVLVIPPFAYMFSSVFITGRFLGFIDFIDIPENESGIYWSFYSETVFGTIFMPLSMGVACIFFNYVLIIYIIEQFNLRQLWDKDNG